MGRTVQQHGIRNPPGICSASSSGPSAASSMPGPRKTRHRHPPPNERHHQHRHQPQGKPVPPEVARQHIERLRNLLASK
jgi:hypothetical protein